MLSLKSDHTGGAARAPGGNLLDRSMLRGPPRAGAPVAPRRAGANPHHALCFHCAFQGLALLPNTRIDVRLLGPCFKTGEWGPFASAVRSSSGVSGSAGRGSDRRTGPPTPCLHCRPPQVDRRSVPCHRNRSRPGSAARGAVRLLDR